MAQAEPGQVKASLPPHPPEDPESFDAILRDLDSVVMPGISHWQHPRFFGYFPSNGSLGSVLGDYVSTGLGVHRPGLAGEPGAERARGGGHRLAAPDGRAVAGLGRRDSGHRLDQHAAGAVVRARAAHQLRSRAGRSAGGAQAAGRLHLGAGAQLGGEGGAARRLRPRRTSAWSPATRRYGMRSDALAAAIAEDARGRPRAVRGGGDHRHHHDHRDRSGGRDRAGRGRHRHLAARRRGDGRLGDGAARMPLDVGGRRGCRLGGAESAQVARRGLRLLGLLRARRRPSGPGDVDQSQLPADRRRRPWSRTTATGASRSAGGSGR